MPERRDPTRTSAEGPRATDLIVETQWPAELDDIVQSLGPAAVVDGSWNGTTAKVRVFGDPGFIRFALESQGYAKVLGEEAIEGA